jgi:hypothetical protein
MLHFVQHDSRVVIPNTLFCHSERMRGIQYGCFTALSMTAVWSFRTLFFVIPNAVRNPVWMLRFVQHDKSGKCGCFTALSMTVVWSFRTLFFVIPSACEESIAWMLRFAQHDKTEDVIPSACEESIAWMLHFAQHDSRVVIPNTLFCHSERQRGIHCVDASLRSA